MDLHTTNGTRHNFKLTYSPPLNPNTPSEIMKYERDQLLPGLRKSLKQLNLFDYGNAEGSGANRAWRTFGQEGRYVTNYAGLRNRIAVLSEAASFQPFKVRIDSTLAFVKGVLKQAAKDADKISRITRDADAAVVKWGTDPTSAPAVGVRFEMAQRGNAAVELEKLAPGEAADHGKAPKNYETVTMPVFDRFVSSKTSRFPAAYLFPASEKKTAELLAMHGIAVEALTGEWQGNTDVYEISEVVQAAQPFQGHRLIRLEGAFKQSARTFGPGSFVVRTAQPLGILAFHILEPESLDGAAAWGFLEAEIKAASAFPICKSFVPITAPMKRLRLQ